MTKTADAKRCRWCGRPIGVVPGPGRPADYCRPSHRQRDYEARRRSAELGLSEAELVVTRRALDELRDQVYILECAVEDVMRDLATDDDLDVHRRSIDWLLEAARPLLATRILGEG